MGPIFTVISAAVLDMRETFYGIGQRGHGKASRPSCCRFSQGRVSLRGMLLRMAGIPFWRCSAALLELLEFSVLAQHCFYFMSSSVQTQAHCQTDTQT